MLLKVCSLVFCGLARADWESIEQGIAAGAAEAANTPPEDASPGAWFGQPRAIGGLYPQLNEYGCWCYFNEMSGRGTAQGPFDELCKNLQRGYRCAIMDGNCEEPFKIKYKGLFGGYLQMDIPGDCAKRNGGPDTCATRACTIETQFQKDVLMTWLEGQDWRIDLMHKNGFDAALQCGGEKPGNGGGGGNDGNRSSQESAPQGVPEKECCGDYPTRFPYIHVGGSRECCNGITYNAALLQCCADGSTSVACS